MNRGAEGNWHELPARWTGPQWPQVVDDLLELSQFGAARSLLQSVGASQHSVELARIGESLVNLDLHDKRLTASRSLVDAELARRLAAVTWPARRDAPDRGPLSTLVPTYELLLEVMGVHIARGEWSNVLAALHLMAEYLPLLAWGAQTGEAGDPQALRVRIADPGARWDTADCPLNRAERAAFGSVLRDDEWDGYLRDRHSRISSGLTVCAGVPVPVLESSSSRVCRDQCSVMSGVTELAWSMTLVRRFRDSALLELRHDAPTGHFFAVPGPAEIDAAWTATWESLVADGVETPAGANPITGLQPRDWREGVAGLLGLVAGLRHAMRPSTVLADIRAAIQRDLPAL